MQLFYKPNFEADTVLDETDSKHCIKVLRHKTGDEVWVTDGAGSLFKCSVSDSNPKKTGLVIREKRTESRTPLRYVHLAVAPTKNLDRISYLVEKAVEIGVQEISFVKTVNSERKEIKTDRIERIAISAMKQSLKSWLPAINEMTSIAEFLDTCTTPQKFVAHLSENSEELVTKNLGESVTILIGPEGDFVSDELIMAKKNGFEQVSMGNSRLRTETAGLVAVTLLNLIR